MGKRTLTVERSTATAHRLTHYDGVCGNVHGHNMKWDVELDISMDNVDDDNMPLDFKEVSDMIDLFDHATILNRQDSLVNSDKDVAEGEVYEHSLLGDTMVFDGDPTCELLSQYVADMLVELEHVYGATVTLYETDKYGMEAHARGHQEVVE